tara:strand:- start:1434 stop:1700 length:267 start_codon:yes stop_codon:yes gene_type:complete
LRFNKRREKEYKERDWSNNGGIEVIVRNNDVNAALRKFKKKVQEAGIIQEVRERQAYVKPSEKRAKQKAAGRARWLKKQAKEKADRGY